MESLTRYCNLTPKDVASLPLEVPISETSCARNCPHVMTARLLIESVMLWSRKRRVRSFLARGRGPPLTDTGNAPLPDNTHS